MSQILSWDALRAKYPDDKYIFLLPQIDMHVQHSVPLWRLDVATLKIDPADESQVYVVEGTKENPKKLALQKPALDRLLAAANGVSRAHVTHEIPGALVRYEGFAAMKCPDGTLRAISRTRDWIGEVAREAVEASADKWAADNDRYRDRKWWHDLSPDQKAAQKAAKLAELWRREREFGPPKAESKAIARAIRALLGIRSGFTLAELRDKSFAVPRWVFEPPADNPEILKMLVANALQGQALLYGSAAQPLALPASQQTQVLALPGGDDDDYDEPNHTPGESPSFTPPPAEPDRPPLMKWDELAAKVAGATCIPHLDNIVKKYTPSAELIGATVQWAVATERRRAELGGHAPKSQPSPEDLRKQEIDGLAKQINALLAVVKIGDQARTSCRAQLAQMHALGNLNGLRDMLLWLEDQPKEVAR